MGAVSPTGVTVQACDRPGASSPPADGGRPLDLPGLRGERGGGRIGLASRATKRGHVHGETMRTIRRVLLMSVIALGAAAAPAVGAAHAPEQAYLFFKVYTDSTVVRLELAIPDVIRALALPWDSRARPTREQIETSLAAIRAYVEPRFAVGAGASRITPCIAALTCVARRRGSSCFSSTWRARRSGARSLSPSRHSSSSTKRRVETWS